MAVRTSKPRSPSAMPAATQRRLDQFIDRSKTTSLTTNEHRELETLLDDVDRKSFWMLAKQLVRARSTAVQ